MIKFGIFISALALVAGALARPAEAVTTGLDRFRTVYVFDTPEPGGLIMDANYTEYSDAAADGTLRDVPLGGDEVGDAVYFGDELPFGSIELDIGEAAPGGGVKWEYWNGTTFTDIVTVTEQFHRTGAFRHDFTPPANWSKRSILGADRYWLRALWTGVPAAPLAKLNQASGLFYNFTFKAQNQDAAVITDLVQSDFIVDACNNGNNAVYGFWNKGSGEYYLALTTGAGCRVTIRAAGYETFGPRGVGTLSNAALVNGGIYTLATAAALPPPPPPPPAPPAPGMPITRVLMKLACPPGAGINDSCKEVFYIGIDGYRHSFPNQAVFFTWYPDGFDSVEILEVTPTNLAIYRLGRNVTHRPGWKLVKSPTNSTVYAVTKGDNSYGMLRAVTTIEIATSLYGPNWARQVTDFSDVFMVNSYRIGASIVSAADYNAAAELAGNNTIDSSMGF